MNNPPARQQPPSSPPRDPGRPSTWRAYSDGLCQGCQALCCSLPVEVSIEDLFRLELLLPEEAQVSTRRAMLRLENSGAIQAFLESSNTFILGQTEDGFCRYLGRDRRCSVYEKRPEVCRTFPSIGPRPGYCPANPMKPESRKA